MAIEFSRLLGGAAAPKFDANKKAKQLAVLLSKAEAVTIDGLEYILPRFGTVPIIMKILKDLSTDGAINAALSKGMERYGDAMLKISGNSPAIPEGYILLPKKPTQAHLNSIAMRYRHDFCLLSDEHKDSALAVARQMYEECSGQGFYTIPVAPQPEGENNE